LNLGFRLSWVLPAPELQYTAKDFAHMQQNEITSLAQYVVSTYRDFVTNRKLLAEKWERNLDAYRRVSNGVWKASEGEAWRSDAFDAVTKQKIVAAVSICIDAYLAGGNIPFDLKPAAVELQALGLNEDDEIPAEIQGMLDKRVDRMRRKIAEQFRTTKADQAMVNHFMAGAIYGQTFAKLAVEPFTKSAYRPIDGTLSPSMEHARYAKETVIEDGPAWNYVSVWDIFTDYEERDLKKCHAVIHRQILSPFQIVEALRNAPGAYPENLKKALKDHTAKTSGGDGGDDTSDESPALRDVPNRKQTLRYIEYWGRVPRNCLDEFTKETGSPTWTMEQADDDEQEGQMVECLVGVVDDTVVRLAVIGDATFRPFLTAMWEDNFDGQGGLGIADNTEDVQKMRNGIIRLFFDNKALSANVQFAVKRELLEKKLEKFRPGQLIDIAEECPDVRQALQQIIVQDVGETLISAIQFTDQWADDDSMVPRVQQGGGSGGKETAFELSQRLEKSGKYLAKVMRAYDDGLVEPAAKWFYDWNMEDPRTQGKGSYEVFATGFTSFQDKIDKLTAMRELLQFASMLPEGQVKLVEIFKELARMSDVDPDQFIVSEAEAANQEPDPMQMAELKKTEAETVKTEAETQKIIADTQMAAEKLKLEMLKATSRQPEKSEPKSVN